MRPGGWAAFAVLSVVILVYSTDFLTGESAYVAMVESLSGKPVDVEDDLPFSGTPFFARAILSQRF